MRTALNDAAEERVKEFAEKSADFRAISGDDAKLWAARHTDRAAIARELEERDAGRFAGPGNRARREEAVAQILRAQKDVDHATFQRARVHAQAKTGTGYHDANGNFDASMMLRDINEVYGDDRHGAGAALASMRGDLTSSGQVAGQAGYATWAQQADDLYNGTVSDIDAHNIIMDDAIDSVNPGTAVYGKPSSAGAMAEAHARRIRAISDGIAQGTNTEADLDAALASAAGILDVMGTSASPQNASAFANHLMKMKIPHGRGTPVLGPNGQQVLDANGQPVMSSPPTTVRELLDQRMSNPEFRTRRKDYGATFGAAAQAQQIAQNAPQPGAGAGAGPPAGGPPVGGP